MMLYVRMRVGRAILSMKFTLRRSRCNYGASS